MAFENVVEIYPSFNLIPSETPLSDGGRWGPFSTRPELRVSNDGFSIHGTVEFAVNGSVYLGEVFTGEIIEAYGCRPDSNLGAALESNRIVALYGDPNQYNGYSSGYGGGIGESYFFRRYSGGPLGFTNIGDGGIPGGGAAGAGVGAPGPEKLGIRITPTDVEQWGYYSGSWNLIQTAVGDTTFRGLTRFALETEEQGGIAEVGWTCFAASSRNRTQIYRIIPA